MSASEALSERKRSAQRAEGERRQAPAGWPSEVRAPAKASEARSEPKASGVRAPA